MSLRSTQGFCVAGIDVETGKWVRLVSDASRESLANSDMLINDYLATEPLDIVEVPVLGACPVSLQPENVLIDTGLWDKRITIKPSMIHLYHETEEQNYLFQNTQYALEKDEMNNLNHSLLMVKVNSLVLHFSDYNKPKVSFRHKGRWYNGISMTDPKWYFYYINDEYFKKNGYRIGDALIVMSVPKENYNNRYYKFVAKILPL